MDDDDTSTIRQEHVQTIPSATSSECGDQVKCEPSATEFLPSSVTEDVQSKRPESASFQPWAVVEQPLANPRVYKRARKVASSIFEGESANQSWSAVTGVSLSDISCLSVLQLPLEKADMDTRALMSLVLESSSFPKSSKTMENILLGPSALTGLKDAMYAIDCRLTNLDSVIRDIVRESKQSLSGISDYSSVYTWEILSLVRSTLSCLVPMNTPRYEESERLQRFAETSLKLKLTPPDAIADVTGLVLRIEGVTALESHNLRTTKEFENARDRAASWPHSDNAIWHVRLACILLADLHPVEHLVQDSDRLHSAQRLGHLFHDTERPYIVGECFSCPFSTDPTPRSELESIRLMSPTHELLVSAAAKSLSVLSDCIRATHPLVRPTFVPEALKNSADMFFLDIQRLQVDCRSCRRHLQGLRDQFTLAMRYIGRDIFEFHIICQTLIAMLQQSNDVMTKSTTGPGHSRSESLSSVRYANRVLLETDRIITSPPAWEEEGAHEPARAVGLLQRVKTWLEPKPPPKPLPRAQVYTLMPSEV